MENKVLWCPLLTIASSSLPTPEGLKPCEKEQCAWWDKVSQCCIVHALSCLIELTK